MDAAFKGCRKLKKINFPPKLNHIGEHAFHRCHSLLSAEVPATVKRLSRGTFLLCDGLENVKIPGVTHLGKQAFSNNENLKRIEISSDLDISDICDIFTGCSKVTEIRFSDGTVFNFESLIEVMSSHSDVHPVIKAISTDIFRMMEISDGILQKLLINVKNVELPDGIKGIAESCFSDKKGLSAVTLPETVTDIGNMAFSNCINLERIKFAGEDINISPDSFKNCTSLKYITLSDGSSYELTGLTDSSDECIPQIVRKIHSQLLKNFIISGTTLMQYRGNEEKVVVPDGITIIGEKAFADNEAIGRVILPDSIREICSEAFSDCLLLQTINIPEGLEYIGKSAFENCAKLIRADLPESLTTIEQSVFNRCRKLKEVLFGCNLNEIGAFAFFACNLLKNINLPQELTGIGDMAFYQCFSLKEITLPESLNKLGNNVFTASGLKSATISCDLTKCGTDIFSQCNKLRELTFDEGVEYIGDKFAFQCQSLKYVDLPSSIKNIGRSAFEGSIYIKEVGQNKVADHIFIDGSDFLGDIVIPDGITAFAGGAFYGNTDITSLTLPKSLLRIGSRAFCGCSSLKSITLPVGITVLEEGVFAYCTSLENVVSQGEIKHISDNAFYECSVISRVPSSDAVHIGKSAFSGCEILEDIRINCTAIQEDAFGKTAFLYNLRNSSPLVIISDIVVDGKYCTEDVIIPQNVVRISPYAFAGNDRITSIKLSDNLVSIGDDAFGGCKNLKEIFLPSLKYVGKKAFEKCVSLNSVSGKVQAIDKGAFSYCVNLKNVSLEETQSLGKEAFCGCAELEVFKCKELQYIGDNCFNGCKFLSDFDFSNIKLIGHSAFRDCNSLKRISLNADTDVAAHAFENCGSIEKIVLSDDGIRFGSYAFAGCTALKTIVIGGMKYITEYYSVIFNKHIPDIVKSVYNSALSCFNIDENFSLIEYKNNGYCVHIPEGIKIINDKVFKDCMDLEQIHIPKSVEYIGERAFQCSAWLEKQKADEPLIIVNDILIDASSCQDEVVIPETVKIVSGWAFANCFGLTGVTFSSSGTEPENHAFRNCINLKKVTTFDGKEYRLSGIFDKNNEMLPPDVRQIFADCLNCFKTDEKNVLVECTGNIDNLILPDGITAVGENVFNDSHLLTYITLANETNLIDRNAFEKCKWLVSVKNASNVKKVGRLAFSGCVLLEHIEFSDTLEHIGRRAFEHCLSLKSIVIPEGITEIPEKAFYRCKSLIKVSLPSTLKIIGTEAFAFCDELAEINFPEELEIIETRAFAWCLNLDAKLLTEGVSVKDDSFSVGNRNL